MKLDFQAEQYSKSGNIAADGIQKLLGNPNLDRFETLIRETVQNSWDARLQDQIPEYSLCVRELNLSQASILRQKIFGYLPSGRGSLDGLINSLNQQSIKIIEIADFFTTGLGGPTNPAEIPLAGEATDFVDFLRNIGSPRDTHHGGGTYGYGKSSLFALSTCNTIIVDTVCTRRGQICRRLMACHTGSRYDITEGEKQGRYTGRHWWGRNRENGFLEPVTNDQATELADYLGLPDRRDGQTGTTIVVMSPEFDEDCTLQNIGNKIVSLLLLNLWPKLVRFESGQRPMDFKLKVDGKEIEIPDPEDCPPFQIFAQTLKAVREKRNGVEIIKSQRPAKNLGFLALQKDLRIERLNDYELYLSEFQKPVNHIALMRPAELVIKYLKGNPLPDTSVEWGGVFMCDDDDRVERAFAASEPPAHDDWVPTNLQPRSHAKTFVNVALKKIKEKIRDYSTPTVEPIDGDSTGSLAGVADLLGKELISTIGSRLGGGRATGSQRRPARGQGNRSQRTGNPLFIGLEMEKGQPCARFELPFASTSKQPILIIGEPDVLLENRQGFPTAPNGKRPKILRWESDNGEILAHGNRLKIKSTDIKRISVLVTMPDYVAVRLRIQEKS